MDKNDFAIYKKGGDILSMGFKFENLLKDNNFPAMIGGGKSKFHNNDFGIPVGLALLNRRLESNKVENHRRKQGGVIKEELFRKLLHLDEQRKSSNSKSKKRKHKRNKKTRKLK